MAISIITQPQKYSPSDNPAIWQVQSDNPNIILFRTTVQQPATNAVISVNDFYTTPVYPFGSYVNLQKILYNYVAPQLEPDINTFAVPLTTPFLDYTLSIQEWNYNSGTTLVQTGSTTGTATATTFNATLSRQAFNKFVYNNYVITGSTSTAVNFLTNKPDAPFVNDLSTEHLYFMTENVNLTARVQTFDEVSNVLLNTYNYSISGNSANRMYRLQASPKALAASIGVSFDNVGSYTIQILNTSNSPVTVLRHYVYVPVDCGVELVNILFENDWGIYDTYQFVNPQLTLNVTKTNLQTDIYGLDNNSVYSDKNGLVYNPSQVTINVTPAKAYIATSKELKDVESYWLQELFKSKSLYVEDNATGEMLPIQITNTNYAITKKRWQRTLANVIQINYQLADGL